MIAAILFYPVLAFSTWIFFLAAMSLKKARDAGRMTNAAKFFGYGVMWIGKPLDFVFNVASSFLFLELPREWLFTSRVSRHIKETGWRADLAKWCCDNFLDPFDPGHCG